MRVLLACLFTVSLGPTAVAQLFDADSSLAAADRLYNAGSYESAELAARRLTEQRSLRDSVRIAAERIIAFSLVAQGKQDLAHDHFVTILTLNPAFDLDPILTSPKIMAVFTDAKVRVAAARRQEPIIPATAETNKPEVSFRTVLFPGWEQWYQDRKSTGLVFFGAGILSLGAGITFELLRAPAREDYLSASQPSDIAGKYATYNRYYRAETYSFIAFAVVYIASEVDVFLDGNQHASIQATLDPAKGPGLVFSLRW